MPAMIRAARLTYREAAILASLYRDTDMQQRRPVMLVILDGWGWREEAADNAVRQAKTPNFDRLWAAGPHALPAHLRQRRRPAATGRWAIPKSAISISAPAAS